MDNLADVVHAIESLSKAVEGVGNLLWCMLVAYVFFSIFGGSSK